MMKPTSQFAHLQTKPIKRIVSRNQPIYTTRSQKAYTTMVNKQSALTQSASGLHSSTTSGNLPKPNETVAF